MRTQTGSACTFRGRAPVYNTGLQHRQIPIAQKYDSQSSPNRAPSCCLLSPQAGHWLGDEYGFMQCLDGGTEAVSKVWKKKDSEQAAAHVRRYRAAGAP